MLFVIVIISKTQNFCQFIKSSVLVYILLNISPFLIFKKRKDIDVSILFYVFLFYVFLFMFFFLCFSFYVFLFFSFSFYVFLFYVFFFLFFLIIKGERCLQPIPLFQTSILWFLVYFSLFPYNIRLL